MKRLQPRQLWPHVRQRRARRGQEKEGRCTTKKAPGKLPDAFKSCRAYLSMTHSAICTLPSAPVLNMRITAPSAA